MNQYTLESAWDFRNMVHIYNSYVWIKHRKEQHLKNTDILVFQLYIENAYFLDKSKLLLCASENIVNEVAADEEIITTLVQGGPRCVPWNELQVYKAIAKSDEDLTCTTTMTSLHRAIWRVAKGKKLEVMMKILKTEENNYTKEFLELVGKWSQLRSGALVR